MLSKYLFFLPTICFAFGALAQGKSTGKKKLKIEIQLEYFQRHCGGARPQNLEEGEPYDMKAYSGRPLYVHSKADRKDKGWRLTPVSDGKFQVSLRPGIYFMYLDTKILYKPKQEEETVCKEWLLLPDGILNIQVGAGNLVKVVVREDCNPCGPPRP